jgi:hypothetical protein
MGPFWRQNMAEAAGLIEAIILTIKRLLRLILLRRRNDSPG